MAGGGATVAGVTGVCEPEGEGTWKGGGRCTQTPGPMTAGQRKPRGACLSLRFGRTRYSVQLKYGSCDDLASSPGQTRGF